MRCFPLMAVVCLSLSATSLASAVEAVLTSPDDGYRWGLLQKGFLSGALSNWEGLGATGLRVTVVKMGPGQSANDALMNNATWFQADKPPTTHFTAELTKAFGLDDYDQAYAWRWTLLSGSTVLTVSPERTFYSPIAAAEWFITNAATVYVLSATNNAFSSFTGTGEISGSKVPVTFENLVLTGCEFCVLQSGVAHGAYTTPHQYAPVSGTAGSVTFTPSEVRLTKATDEIYGTMSWTTPDMQLEVGPTWLNALFGSTGVFANDTMVLPAGTEIPSDLTRLTVTLGEESFLHLNAQQQTFRPYLYGTIASTTGPKLNLEFNELRDPSLADFVPGAASLEAVSETGLDFVPGAAHIDLSSIASSDAADPAWKGLSLSQFALGFLPGTPIDWREDDEAHALLALPSAEATYDESGLDLLVSEPLANTQVVLFGNDAELTSIELSMTDSHVEPGSQITGTVYVATLDRTFEFVLPITDAGFGAVELQGDVPAGFEIGATKPRLVSLSLEGVATTIDQDEMTVEVLLPDSIRSLQFFTVEFVALGTRVEFDRATVVSGEQLQPKSYDVEVFASDDSSVTYALHPRFEAESGSGGGTSSSGGGSQVLDSPAAPVLIAPAASATAVGVPVEFVWKEGDGAGAEVVRYEVYVCQGSDFSECDEPACTVDVEPGAGVALPPLSSGSKPFSRGALLGLLACAFALLRAFGTSRGNRPALRTSVVATSLLVISCGGSDSEAPAASSRADGELTCTVDSLENDTRYQWKVVAVSSEGAETSSLVRGLTTEP